MSGKGFAASASGEAYYVSTSLDAPISTSLSGSPGGGWPLQFSSSSSQLGQRPTRVYLRFRSEIESHIADVYMLPDPAGYTDQLHAILCSSTISNSSGLPAIPFLGLQSVPSTVANITSSNERGEGNEDRHGETSTGSTDTQGVLNAPWQDIAAEFNITDLPAGCRYYAGRGLTWSLVADQLVMPAPPQAVFTALHHAAEADAAGSSSRRRLAQASNDDDAAPVQADLFVNSQTVTNAEIEYDASAGPRVTSVTPSVVSAAVSQVPSLSPKRPGLPLPLHHP